MIAHLDWHRSRHDGSIDLVLFSTASPANAIDVGRLPNCHRALVNQPDLVLADEPTGALDSRTGEEVMDLVSGLHQLGITIVLVTHDSGVAARTQRIIRLQDGRIIADG